MAILTAPIAGKEKEVAVAFSKVVEAKCPGAKLSVRFRKEYDGYSLTLEKKGKKRDLYFHEIRLTDDYEQPRLIAAVEYEAESLEKSTKYG